jgi:hypothetical protein
MVDVVVESGRVDVVVVEVVAPLKWGPTTDPTNPAKASAPRNAIKRPRPLTMMSLDTCGEDSSGRS